MDDYVLEGRKGRRLRSVATASWELKVSEEET